MAEGSDRIEPDKVHVPDGRKSYLMTIYGKALDARAEHPILGDTYAEAAVDRIDFDFEKLAVGGGAAITLPFRAKFFDDWTREFLAAYPVATVLHLGCGLDTRVFRVDPPPTVRWYDVDFPDAIDLRRQLYPDRPGYEMIGASIADLRWLDPIPGDTPVLMVAEGFVQYLTEADRDALFTRITEQFPSGQLIFDAYGGPTTAVLNMALRLQRTGLRLYGPLKTGHELEQRVPRLKLVSVVSFLTLPEMVPLLVHSKAQAWLAERMGSWEWYRRSIQHFRYEF